MTNIITFEQALAASEKYSKRHLLLGNGFSIACIPTIFTYSSLYNKADFSMMPEVEQIFEALQTQDFELVIDALERSSKILPIYNSKRLLTAKKMHKHAQALKEILIQTLAHNHPEYPSIIAEEKYDACLGFLSHFIDRGSCIYTLNYDLLLYWTVMNGMNRGIIKTIPLDGFGKDTDFEDGESFVSEYVTWQGDSKAHGQNIHYLHGALHLYDRGPDIEKFTWVNTGLSLIDQARYALSEGRFPLFVAEGESIKKMEKITHSGYLFHSYKSFSANMKTGNKTTKNCLFTYGVSFGENDAHILKKISQGIVAHIFVSIYGDPESIENKRIIESVERLKRKRKFGQLEVTYYDAVSAKVWG